MKTSVLALMLAVWIIPVRAQEAAEEKLKRLEAEVEKLGYELDQVRISTLEMRNLVDI